MRKCVLLAALLCAVVLCSPAAAAPKEISLTYIKPPLNVPSIVERRLGFFSRAFAPFGCSVVYSPLTNGPDQVRALAAGDVHFLNAVGSTSVFLSASNGADVKILSIFGRSPQAFKLVAAKDSPLSRPSDLRGKLVGGPRGTILHELLAAWLAEDGMTVRDVKFVNMGIAAAQAALAAGKIDVAMVTGIPAWRMARSGYKVLRDGSGIVNGEILTVTTGRFAAENPELVRAFMAAKREVLQWMRDNPEKTLEIVMEEMGLTREEVEDMHAQYDFSMDIAPSDVEGLQKTVDFMTQQGMTAAPVSVADLILKVED
ncbi:MAG: NrtA/SsuA/CpmA family ABC transporter substrate-binding protein [Pyramidobacter sp.]|nr:NrtA/SsuA/CpmA family ABC transporter substrate-binding protein [Pyramidobacter sp.]